MRITFKIVDVISTATNGKAKRTWFNTVEAENVQAGYDVVRKQYAHGLFNIYCYKVNK